MKYVKHLVCTGCGTTYPETELMNLCPQDNRPLQFVMDVAKIKNDYPDESWHHDDLPSMWRFGALLPLNIDDNDESHCIFSLGEGHTPVLDFTQYAKTQLKLNIDFFIKDEGQPHQGFGANPTGSFKDRGMAMVASMARFHGIHKLVVPTQGNAGDSLAEYSLKAGFETAVIMPDDTPMPILGKVSAYAQMHEKIHLDLVSGTIREAAALMKEKYLPQGYFNCATFQEPGWRIEGKKTMGLELAEPWPGIKDSWSLPDVILYPTGGGTGILGMWKAFDELEQLGMIDSKRPRIIAVQSEKNAPVVHALQNNLKDTIPTDGGQTLATGLNVPGGVGHFKVLDIVRQSGGGGITVSESAIADQLSALYRDYRLWISPEGAATVAALQPAFESGLIKSSDSVVCFNTGSFEKYLPNVRKLLC
ncbi:threonine synthase [Pleionea sp. CnH1-48]|uniref:threonine synthase n=1 Tax=Pleionea sp. CnH1-48 TaxID=2954494 RepID=UPI002098519E|nr:threonine synthase [Pleionea sp. CnH1-48]MCO7223496.1 threonine synthase [Pleionea sp. CnH1-48]